VRQLSGAFIAEEEAQSLLDRESRFDSDIWIVEIEDREGRHFLGDDLIDESA
jgi:hypothetical protein